MADKANVTLYLGGTRSGKSARAEAHALQYGGPVLYVATAGERPGDPSMVERLRRHRARRPAHWRTLECPLHLADCIAATLTQPRPATAGAMPTILLDCVTLWVSNILFSLPDPEDLQTFEAAVREEMEALLGLIEHSGGNWVLVSGETGLGGIESTLLGRNYCDGLGLANQLIASRAKNIFLVVAGCPLQLPPPQWNTARLPQT